MNGWNASGWEQFLIKNIRRNHVRNEEEIQMRVGIVLYKIVAWNRSKCDVTTASSLNGLFRSSPKINMSEKIKKK